MAERSQMQLGYGVEIGGDPGVAAESRGIPADHENDGGGGAFHCAHGVAEHVHGGGAAVGILQQPAQGQAELPGKVDRRVGRERKGSNGQPIDFAGCDLRVRQRGDHRVAHEGLRALPSLRPPDIGGLPHANNGGVYVHGVGFGKCVERASTRC